MVRLRDEIDLAEVMGTERLVSEETGDWIPPDGTESLISDIEWAPDGTQLAVATYPGFFEADCLPEAESCDARIWTFDRDGGDPEAVHRQSSDIREEGAWLAPILTDLAWTSDSSRLGMVLTSDNQDGDKPPPSLVALDLESGSASNAARVRATAGAAGRPGTASPGRRTAGASRSPVATASACSTPTGPSSRSRPTADPVRSPGSARRWSASAGSRGAAR